MVSPDLETLKEITQAQTQRLPKERILSPKPMLLTLDWGSAGSNSRTGMRPETVPLYQAHHLRAARGACAART